MRIIAGRHRGRSIVPPRDQETTRPIVDRVKEALFSRLLSLGMLAGPDEQGEGGEPWQAVDVFAGTGSMGLECLSRGAAHVWFVERDRDALRRLGENLASLKEEPRATVLATSALSPIWTANLREPVRLVFLDPPYAMMKEAEDRARLEKVMAALVEKMEEGGVVVLRTAREDDPLPVDEAVWDGPVSFRYGSMTLHFYQRPLPEEAGESDESDDADEAA